MANQEHVNILRQGTEVWNRWREEKPDIQPILTEASLVKCSLQGANLKGVRLNRADLSKADLQGADFRNAIMKRCNLFETNLTHAQLYQADLREAILLGTILNGANLVETKVYGISAWDIQLEGSNQKDLIITNQDKPNITVDNLEVAQFIYLLLNNQKIRDVIDTITSKVVLILGRFTPERKPVLDALKDELRKHNFSPVVFDFEPSAKRDLTETISTLAHMSRFVIADLTDAKSIPQELQAIVPHLPSVPIQPILQRDATEYAMFEHYERYPWVLPIYRYQDIPDLLASIKEDILKPVDQKEHEKEKNRSLEEEVKNKSEKIRELEEKVRMLEQNK